MENKKCKKNNLESVAILSDFDGTLRDDSGNIPERNIKAIEHLKSCGGYFALASGRAEFVLDTIAPSVKTLVNYPCILSNGSYLYDYSTDTRIRECFVSEEKLRQMLYDVRDIAPEVAIRMIRGTNYITPDKNEEILKQIELGYMQNVEFYTYDTIPTDRINKINICSSPDNIKKIRNMLEEKYSDEFDLNMSWRSILEIQAKNVSKGTMLEYVKEELKRTKRNIRIYAVGDYENDLEMMRRADYACCPSNALEVVKEYCNIHLCSNNDGAIADLIEKIEKGLA